VPVLCLWTPFASRREAKTGTSQANQIRACKQLTTEVTGMRPVTCGFKFDRRPHLRWTVLLIALPCRFQLNRRCFVWISTTRSRGTWSCGRFGWSWRRSEATGLFVLRGEKNRLDHGENLRTHCQAVSTCSSRTINLKWITPTIRGC
jgi:hypothetical protein